MLLVVLYHFSITATTIILPTLELSATKNIMSSLGTSAVYWVIAAIVLFFAGAKRLVR